MDGFTTAAIIGLTLGLVLTVCWPWPWKRRHRNPRPTCFGTYPSRHPHIWAERDCQSCPYQNDCFEESPHV